LEVTIAIPIYKTTQSIFKLLNTIKKQSYQNFNILIIYKEWPGCEGTISKIKKYRDLRIEVLKQDQGYFEEALNMIYRKADGEIVIHTDDDAWISKNWVKDHVELHKKYKKVGMATGMVIEDIHPNGTPLPFFKKLINDSKWLMNKHTIIDKLIDDRFNGYGMYIGRSGMLVDTGKRYDMIKTLKQHGVNMSWKREALEGFKLPGFTRYGGGNEACAALETLNRGYIPIWFNGAQTFHPIHESLSRGTSVSTLPIGLTAERVLFSYYTSNVAGYNVDLDTLRLRNKLDILLASFISNSAKRSYRLGYEIANEAIEKSWSAKMVRKELIARLNE
jgi:glycosyltransferase involved in cell wall biosynthesis